MARVSGPMMSLGSSGQFGKTMVSATWRGLPYMRRYVTPANPNSESQQATRGVFAWCNGVWKLMNPAAQAPWVLFSRGKPLTDRNAFIKKNLSNLRGTDAVPATTLALIQTSPGANGGLAALSIATADQGDHTLNVTITPPEVPAGWTVVGVHALVFVQANANTSQVYTSYYAHTEADPWLMNIAGVGAGTYEATGWVEYTKPDGTTAYSPSLSHAQVVA